MTFNVVSLKKLGYQLLAAMLIVEQLHKIQSPVTCSTLQNKMRLALTIPLDVRHGPKTHATFSLPSLYTESMITKLKHMLYHLHLQHETIKLIITTLEEIQVLQRKSSFGTTIYNYSHTLINIWVSTIWDLYIDHLITDI